MGINVTDAPGRERFEAHDDAGVLAGFLTYQVTGSIAVYTHTEVKEAFQGRGVGSVLVRAALDDARARGRTVVPICPYVLGWLGKHPGYEDVVARTTKKVK